MDMLQVHVCGYMLQVHVHGYVIGKMYVNMLSYRYIQLDVHHFIGMLYGLVIMFYRQCFFLSVFFSFPFFSPFTGVSIHFLSETVVSFCGFLCD